MKKDVIILSVLFMGSLLLLSFKGEQSLPVIQNPEGKDLPTVTNFAFKRGEILAFRVHYGIIDAGVASLTVTEEIKEIGGRKTYHVVGLGSSQGTFDWFYKVRDRYESYIDEQALVPWIFVRRVNEGGLKFSQDYVFNHFNQKVSVGNGEVFNIEPNMQDMISAFYFARNIDFSTAKAGDLFELKCFLDKEIWPLKIKYIGKETISSDIGKIRCLKFRPVVQKGRVFKNEEDLTVWISDDKNHIPVRGQANILVGSIKMDLVKYEGLANPLAKE